MQTTETMVYTEPSHNYLASYTDARGETTTYTYDEERGLKLSETNPRGNTITYTYNPLTDELVSTT